MHTFVVEPWVSVFKIKVIGYGESGKYDFGLVYFLLFNVSGWI